MSENVVNKSLKVTGVHVTSHIDDHIIIFQFILKMVHWNTKK